MAVGLAALAQRERGKEEEQFEGLERNIDRGWRHNWKRAGCSGRAE